MKKSDHDKYYKFLNVNKKLVGLSDWKVILSSDNLETDNFAEVEPELYEKEMVVKLSEEFHKLSASRKKNILLHELIHGRVEIYNKKRDQMMEELEEEYVNDITRGFERHKNLTW